MIEQERVKESLAKIFKQNSYAELNRLTQRDFDHVSQEIQNRTGILISGTTLKRLLHGEFSRLPQIATLDAISKYLGYNNWQEYKSALRTEFVESNKNADKAEDEVYKNAPATSRKFKLIAILCLGIVSASVVGFIRLAETKQLANIDKASFSARKTTSNEVPNTVVFNYNVDEVNADSFFIQQSWDRNRRRRIFKNSYTFTDIYYEPGYHVAKLIANDSVISAVDVSIPTDRWFFFAKDNPHSNPEYIGADNIISNGILGLTEKHIKDSKIDITREKEYAYTFFPSKLGVSSDDYVLNARVRVRSVKNNICPYMMIEVFTQRFTSFFKSTSRGCSSESMLQFGEQFIGGKENDLSSIAFDVMQWTDIELSVKSRHVTIIINNKQAFSTTYNTTSKLITGLGFVSNGLCEIDFVKFRGLDEAIVYESNFEENKSF